MLRKFGLSFVLLALIANQPLAAERLTLNQTLSRALEASPELRISVEDVNIAKLQEQEAGGRRLPQLDFLGSYLYTSEVMSLDQPATTISLPPPSPPLVMPGRKTSFGDNHAADFKLQVSQPLFTGLKLSRARQAARYSVEQQEAEADRVRWQVRIRAEETYVNVQKTASLLRIARLRMERMQRHLKDAQNRQKQGVVPQEVVARAQFALSQARLQQQEADHGHQLALIALRDLLDLPQNGEELQLDSLEIAALPLEPSDFGFAKVRRAEFRSLEAQAAVMSQIVGVEKGAYYPSIAVFAAVDYARPGIDKVANEWMLYELAGVNLSWTLWDWNIRKSKVEQMRAAQRQLEQSRSALESRIRLELSNAQSSLDNAQKRVHVAQEGLKLSEDVLRWVQDRYAQGVATEKEYLDAQGDYSASQIDYVVALADQRLALLALKSALGGDL